ncbi:sulfatase-like hydrolase/transferase [Brachybacterium sp. FME24]|uniref:sulfatase-like hydrolase/transferase n=1 Tax=Brachybacterium sp. FME24 TaxID=2742605 RepID=UPI00186619B4|nr:sulfatase-like hydrolase/transferase [Brachybacterium sp. FME24]
MPAETARPNVLLLVTDDQGSWALRTRTPELHTPTLDRLQREGTTLPQFYCASPVCSPARASMMTGRMPSAHGIHDWILPEALARTASPRRPLDPDFLADLPGADTIAAMLSRDGYRCGMVGKWHVGSSDAPAPGFDYWYAHQLGGGSYYGAPIWEQDPATGVPAVPAQSGSEPRYLTDALTERGLDFLGRGPSGGDERPFFLQVNWTAPHDPWLGQEHPGELRDLYRDTDFPSIPQLPDHPWFVRENFAGPLANRHEALAGYGAAVSGVDRSVAQLLAHLEQTGELARTVVLFTSDNGFSCGHHGVWGKGNATWPLNFWEPSITVPFIARWPGVIPAGHVDQRPTSATSLYETLAELTGAMPAPDPLRAGRSFAPRLLGADLPTEADDRIVIHDEYGAARMIRTDGWKLVLRREGPVELYDLEADPLEDSDRSGDPASAARRRDLTDAMTSWFADHEVAALSGWSTGTDGAGQSTPPRIIPGSGR